MNDARRNSDDEGEPFNLGPCCICECATPPPRNLLQMDFEGPPGAIGWGCVVCHLPPRGAVAVICDNCILALPMAQAAERLKFLCGGTYATERVRVPLAGFSRIPFTHDMALHSEIQ